MKIVKRLVKVLLSIVLVFAIVYLSGYLLPSSHTVTVSSEVNLPVERTWELITDFQSFPSWRSNVKAIKEISNSTWIEVSHNESIKYTQQEAIVQKTLTTQIASTGLPYSGKWIFNLEAQGSKTLLTITEQGEVYNPIFRIVSAYIIGHSASIDQYFTDLQQVKD